MVHSATSMVDAVAAIVEAMRARSGFRSPWVDGTGVPVYHSVEVGLQEEDARTVPLLLVIGDVGDPVQPAEAGDSANRPATLGTRRAKTERATVRCRAVAQTADHEPGTVPAQWSAAADLIDAVDDELRGPVGIGPTLGLASGAGGYQALVASVAQVDGVVPMLSAGVMVQIPFRIEIETRL